MKIYRNVEEFLVDYHIDIDNQGNIILYDFRNGRIRYVDKSLHYDIEDIKIIRMKILKEVFIRNIIIFLCVVFIFCIYLFRDKYDIYNMLFLVCIVGLCIILGIEYRILSNKQKLRYMFEEFMIKLKL
jgi:hypothetical protein